LLLSWEYGVDLLVYGIGGADVLVLICFRGGFRIDRIGVSPLQSSKGCAPLSATPAPSAAENEFNGAVWDAFERCKRLRRNSLQLKTQPPFSVHGGSGDDSVADTSTSSAALSPGCTRCTHARVAQKHLHGLC
jgi:hypothetical protein